MSASLRRALEEELAASPDDVATHAAYADLLEEMDDPRGEFIQVQMALEDPSLDAAQRQQLTYREGDLLRQHRDRILGRLAPHLQGEGVSHQIRRGWLDRLEIGRLSLPFARALRDAPEARLLSHLAIVSATLHDVDPEPSDNAPEDEHYSPGPWPLVGADCLKNLRVLRLGDEEDDYEDFQCSLSSDAVVPLARSAPRLEQLHVFAYCPNLNHLFTLQTLRHLRILRLYHSAQVHRLDLLAGNAAFRDLTHLLLHPHALSWGDNRDEDERQGFVESEGYLPLRVVEPLLRSPNLPHLTHLQFRTSSMGDAGCRAIVDSGILRRLKSLDLRHGCITNEGAWALLECPDLHNLTWLDLSYNSLSDATTARLGAQGIAGRFDHQHGAGDEEDQYLYEGDSE
jgi:uncharacterized protein (TIGR02996 family)